MWKYQNIEFTDDEIVDHVGFVYQIIHKPTGKSYVGKKLFTSAKTIQKNKRKKRVRVSSDWKSYWGSNDQLREEVRTLGEDQFERHILRLCKTKTEMGYWELKIQMQWDVLLYPDKYYNSFIGYKAHRRNVLKGHPNA